MKKTKAMMILDQAGLDYEVIDYGQDIEIDGETIAQASGLDPDLVFKTLVATSGDRDHYVFLVPVNQHLDMKKAARATGQKKVKMLATKDLKKVTGYIRGGCTPLGMKKAYPVYFDEGLRDLGRIYISAGQLGLELGLDLKDLAGMCDMNFADILREDG